MPKESVLIVGLGQVGHALFELFKESGKFDVYGFDLDEEKTRSIVGAIDLPKVVDVMHVCYPCVEQETFVKATLDYMKKFKPKLTIIESTVAPGTTQKIFEIAKSPVVNSPVRGRYKNLETMKKDILFWSKYIGAPTKDLAIMAERHFQKLGLKTKVLRSPVETELAKLFETIYRAWMIVCFQEMHRISRYFNAVFNDIVDFLEDVHRIRFDRPILFPGVINGCLIPNTELLLGVYNSELLRLILDSNERRKREIEDDKVVSEIEEIKKRVEDFQKELKRFLMKG